MEKDFEFYLNADRETILNELNELVTNMQEYQAKKNKLLGVLRDKYNICVQTGNKCGVPCYHECKMNYCDENGCIDEKTELKGDDLTPKTTN